jgi:hypothetical protein
MIVARSAADGGSICDDICAIEIRRLVVAFFVGASSTANDDQR